ncbi:MAG TPA: Rpn family recombination-promoting nuclease/putative transposase [Myxococcaceae bacterium]|jgi:hypothetical protein
MPGPHDLFARHTFGQPEHAASELKAALPPELVSQVDWESLRLEPSNVVDTKLRETESDLLFSARLRGGKPLLFYVLLEHQSSVDPWMAWRMLRYVLRQLENWRQQHPDSAGLPVIVPLVLYHGVEGGWTAPRRVEDLFEVPEEEPQRSQWRAWVPRFEYAVDDLTQAQAEALMERAGSPLVRLAWLALRFGRTEELVRQLPGWVGLFSQLWKSSTGSEELRAVVRYLLLVGGEAARPTTVGVLTSAMGTQLTEELMFEKEFIEKGRQEGLAEGVLRILAVRGVQVGEQARQRILSCKDMALLNQWFDRAINATRLSDVLES